MQTKMEYIILLVKGSREEAIAAAKMHLPAAHPAWAVQILEGESILAVDMHAGREVAEWYLNPPFVAPFPIGTLLHYAAWEPPEVLDETPPFGDVWGTGE